MRSSIEQPIVRRVTPPGDVTPTALTARRDAGESFPIVDRETCTFAYHGAAISVRLAHFGVGLPDNLRFQPLGESECKGLGGAQDWWVLSLRFPAGSRLEYKLDVTDSFGTRLIEDPLNARHASHPFGANSVCEAGGYVEPDWSREQPDVARGTIRDLGIESAALGRRAHASVYLPAEFQQEPRDPYPLVIVHDGGDYLRFAAASTVLDNLVHRRAIPAPVAVFLQPGERLVEYADDARHHAYLTGELLPQLERELPISTEPSRRCLVGASFGAVASLSVAVRHPQTFGLLLLQSGAFAGAGVGCWPRPEALWRPIKQFVRAFIANPAAVAERLYVTCGMFESLICENRGLVPVLESTGMDVTFDESLDGHNWASWRDTLGVALPTLLASARG
jgi:enterochelin esterase-like enzyme